MRNKEVGVYSSFICNSFLWYTQSINPLASEGVLGPGVVLAFVLFSVSSKHIND